jgi:hypothetical protein
VLSEELVLKHLVGAETFSLAFKYMFISVIQNLIQTSGVFVFIVIMM